MRYLCLATVLASAACSQAAATPSPHIRADAEAQPAREDAGVRDGEADVALVHDAGAVVWDGWAGEFFVDYCVSCHNPKAYCVDCHMPGDPATPDYSQKGPVVANASTIRCGVGTSQSASWHCGSVKPREFPKLATPPTNPVPSDEDRARIEGWFDAGCP